MFIHTCFPTSST